MLDALAAGEMLDFEAIRNALAAEKAYDDEELRALLELLRSDHYLVKGANGYSFYLEIVRRWWALARQF